MVSDYKSTVVGTFATFFYFFQRIAKVNFKYISCKLKLKSKSEVQYFQFY